MKPPARATYSDVTTPRNLETGIEVCSKMQEALSGMIQAADYPENRENRDAILQSACEISSVLIRLNNLCPDTRQ